MTECRGTPHALTFGFRRDGVIEPGFRSSSFRTGGGAPHPVARKPRMALQSKDRATAARMLPCHACTVGHSG